MKKGQMEIMGLVVIVLLITIGMFFIIRFVVFGEEEQTLKGYTQTQSASNFLSTLRKTTTNCSNLDIEQLIQACVTNSQKVCEGMNVCNYVNQQIGYLLDNTIVAWGNRPYHFKAYISEGNPLMEQGKMDSETNKYVCTDDDPGDLKQEFIPTTVGNIVTLELKICD